MVGLRIPLGGMIGLRIPVGGMVGLRIPVGVDGRPENTGWGEMVGNLFFPCDRLPMPWGLGSGRLRREYHRCALLHLAASAA
jgi:hypothetical protein